jgi:hypothetical protein
MPARPSLTAGWVAMWLPDNCAHGEMSLLRRRMAEPRRLSCMPRATRVFVISDLHLGGEAPAMMSFPGELSALTSMGPRFLTTIPPWDPSA